MGQISRCGCRSYLAATLSWRLVAVFVETSASVTVTGSAGGTAPPPVRTRLLHSGIRENTTRDWAAAVILTGVTRNMALVTLKYDEVEIMTGRVTWIGKTGQSAGLICVAVHLKQASAALEGHGESGATQLKPTRTDALFFFYCSSKATSAGARWSDRGCFSAAAWGQQQPNTYARAVRRARGFRHPAPDGTWCVSQGGQRFWGKWLVLNWGWLISGRSCGVMGSILQCGSLCRCLKAFWLGWVGSQRKNTVLQSLFKL